MYGRFRRPGRNDTVPSPFARLDRVAPRPLAARPVGSSVSTPTLRLQYYGTIEPESSILTRLSLLASLAAQPAEHWSAGGRSCEQVARWTTVQQGVLVPNLLRQTCAREGGR